jgi:hypothetical protein
VLFRSSCTPQEFALAIADWPRPLVESAIEWLIDLLDAKDADLTDREPDDEMPVLGDGYPGDPEDAEEDLQLLR